MNILDWLNTIIIKKHNKTLFIKKKRPFRLRLDHFIIKLYNIYNLMSNYFIIDSKAKLIMSLSLVCLSSGDNTTLEYLESTTVINVVASQSIVLAT